MRIGILTFHRSVNNGAVLQAFSLSNALKRRFPSSNVEIIDYCTRGVYESYHYSIKKYFHRCNFRTFLYKFYKLIKEPKMLKRLNKRTIVFENAQNQLMLSKYRLVSDNYEELFNYINNNYDVLIVGSDAVWNYVSKGFPNAYFPNASIKCKKISYAASCYGMVFEDFSLPNRDEIGNILSNFSLIGVRDKATADFVIWSNKDLKPIHTCDPTLLLDLKELPVDSDDLLKKLKKKGFDFKKETIGIMGNDRMLKMIRKMYGRRYQIASLYNYLKGADVQLFDLNPFEWAYVFKFFKITFTTYFHGTMLSLCNGVPVVCFSMNTPFEKCHVPKTLDALKRLGFEDNFFQTDYRSISIEDIKKKADELLSHDFRAIILDRIKKEAKTGNDFLDLIDNTLFC